MGLSVNTNIAALNSYRNLSNTQNDLSKSLEKLSSGLRINRAADDAAGLAISEGLRAQIGGTQQAVRNAQDGISVVQTAEGALTETHSILQRMRTLSVQAANDGGLSATAKTNIQDEITQLKTELTRIADTTQFNGKKLLNGSYDGVFQVGANTSSADKITVTIDTAVSAAALGVADVDVTSGFTGTAAKVDSWTGGQVDLLATTQPANTTITLQTGVSTTQQVTVNLDGWDTSGTAAAAVANKSLLQTSLDNALAGTGYSAGTEYNADGTTADITFYSSKVDAIAGHTTAAGDVAIAGGITGTIALAANVDSPESGAALGVRAIDTAINTVSQLRSQLGAVQNRFDHTINNLNVAVENLTASESRIRDTDMASEMVSYTRAQILSQAGTAMLAQAKVLPQSVLQLLQ